MQENDFFRCPRLCNTAFLLGERLVSSCDWVTRHLSNFFPPAGSPHTVAHVKSLAELALVLRQLEGTPVKSEIGSDITGCASTWREFVICQLERQVYAEMPRRRPTLAYAYLVPYLLVRGSYSSDYYEYTLGTLGRAGTLLPAELLPYRVLDRHYVFWAGGMPLTELDWLQLYHATDLGQGKALYYHDEDLAYAVTHTIFYLTDFGRLPATLPKTEVARVIAILERFLVHYWRVANWDLVGELLTCLNSLGVNHSIIYYKAQEAFHAVWGENGSVPPRTGGTASLSPDDEDSSRVFRERYHTTLVGILYCLSSLRLGRE